MSTTITPTQSIDRPVARAFSRRERRPWVHPGVASERADRAERAYAAELVHTEHHAARVRGAALGGAR
jgi:hypothetical protein